MEAVIFDIDGTLSDASHRLHFVKGERKNWPAFFDALVDDPVHEPIKWLAQVADREVPILLVSGRPEDYRAQTEAWMERNGIRYHSLYMRPSGDFRPDDMVKSQILDGLIADGWEIILVVDDRPRVIDMWRSRGLTCLQCREWEEDVQASEFGLLTLMVGPSGAGKTTWLGSSAALEHGIHPDHIVSSDKLRRDFCGDFKDQAQNDAVFATLHAVVKARISHGAPCTVDATNIKRKDRMILTGLSNNVSPVRYIVINRPMADKRRDGGWRNEVPGVDLLEKHEQTFRSQLKDILAGDNLPNVSVVDLRNNL